MRAFTPPENNNKYYLTALRYFENAKEQLKMAGKDGKYYTNTKYVSIACGTAYKAVLIALDGFFRSKGIKKPKQRPSIEYYQENLSKLDKKMLNSLNVVYQILHLDGYYDAFNHVKIIQTGFKEAEFIINKLK